MITVTMIVAADPERGDYPSPREVQLECKPAAGERLQEGYDSYHVTQVSQHISGGVTVYVKRE